MGRINPEKVSQLTGHDVQTLDENYAENVNNCSSLFEIIF